MISNNLWRRSRNDQRVEGHRPSGFIWHAGAFAIINAFFWIMDLALGAEGLQWSFWITAAWGFALAFHALAYYVDGRRLAERKAQRYIDEERRRRG